MRRHLPKLDLRRIQIPHEHAQKCRINCHAPQRNRRHRLILRHKTNMRQDKPRHAKRIHILIFDCSVQNLAELRKFRRKPRLQIKTRPQAIADKQDHKQQTTDHQRRLTPACHAFFISLSHCHSPPNMPESIHSKAFTLMLELLKFSMV